MSRYRDDTQETAVAGNSTWLRIRTIAEDTAKATSTLLFALLVTHLDAAAASDQVIDRAGQVITEHAIASDAAPGHLRAAVLVQEQRRLVELFAQRLRVLHADTATASDAVIDKARAVIVEQATIHDQVIGQRHVRSVVSESARAGDFTGQFASVLVSDSATASDWAGGRLLARVELTDAAMLADELVDSQHAAAAVLMDSARASDLVLDHLHAFNLVQDGALVEDAMPAEPVGGQAWTANADTWAMSRYAPFAFSGLAVIDGKLYASAEDGVYQLGVQGEAIEARLATSKLDIGKGGLVHPDAAYLEYELDGTAVMDVTTTQSGTAATYSYPLAAEPAGELTNGRFKFGRGLRGRHFSFVLRLSGQHAYINDLSVESAPTKRRV